MLLQIRQSSFDRIQNVDQILFVQNGKVVEQGTHNELMACNGRYKDFQDV